ncbi:glycerol-3-phosphate acyltransferase [Phormidium yuhuli AB48]|uniref:Glycerol-3-phosphate acyltransferase n=1 Tax=Phormidium yuhuli AB48 TaxID=2940671 RepID=A0ABY5ALN2_9CYAN|nr:glycerol-3-phosphate acyltransferase [Phormidium yuhuli]USR89661.1 glycerol-3-phosphate acyltransferase [Phormidium yuhuli AB48]
MPLSPLLAASFILLASALLGGLPLLGAIVRWVSDEDLSQTGTGNLGVSAAFYHGGTPAGVLAVLSEAAKGILVVLLARWLLPQLPSFELFALIALVLGRYGFKQGAGTTNTVWGIVTHDWRIALFVALISGASFTLIRERQAGRNLSLALLPAITWMLYPHSPGRLLGSLGLSCALYAIYQTMSDDLDLPLGGAQADTRKLFRFFRADRVLLSLDRPLTPEKVGLKAASLSQLRRWGYPVPPGWVFLPGDDSQLFAEALEVSPDRPLIARSSALTEDSELASAAGQYESVANLTSPAALEEAIDRCLASYDTPAAVQYRQERQQQDEEEDSAPGGAMAVLVQEQVAGVFSGVAFSRDPVSRCGDAVAIEALPGEAAQVVSGQVTPERYHVSVSSELATLDWRSPATGQDERLVVSGDSGDVPLSLLRRVAVLARQLEQRLQNVPQDLEWSYDGDRLWVLQARPISTLLPIWTRQIAAEVIPGFIRPLTWSINRPLTCGVWGEIFSIVLGDRAHGLDFSETATLHYSSAYFNASLLGDIFRRMGLPPESLAFLTEGASMSRPSLRSTLTNLPGLLRLLRRQWVLEQEFNTQYQREFLPLLETLESRPACRFTGDRLIPQQSPPKLLERIQDILQGLEGVTYYNILAPLGFAAKKAIFKVDEASLDNQHMPEVAALAALENIAESARNLLPEGRLDVVELFVYLAESNDGQEILKQLEVFLEEFGYLSEVGTDIAVATWREDPRPVRALFAQLVQTKDLPASPRSKPSTSKAGQVQRALNLKGNVAQVYGCLLAELRWSFRSLEQQWLESGVLREPGDIFFLVFHEVRGLVEGDNPDLLALVPELVAQRRAKWERDRQRADLPYVTYGKPPMTLLTFSSQPAQLQLSGIGASAGQAEGPVKIVRQLSDGLQLPPHTILVVPYTDSGWMPLLARASGLISQVGGRLSHGAIVAREYGIPAVMNVANATNLLKDGQRVRLDGETGTIEILS